MLYFCRFCLNVKSLRRTKLEQPEVSILKQKFLSNIWRKQWIRLTSAVINLTIFFDTFFYDTAVPASLTLTTEGCMLTPG